MSSLFPFFSFSLCVSFSFFFHYKSEQHTRNTDRPLFNHKFRIGVNANIHGIVRYYTKNRYHPLDTPSLSLYFCRYGKESSLFWVLPQNLFQPLVLAISILSSYFPFPPPRLFLPILPRTCSRSRKIYPRCMILPLPEYRNIIPASKSRVA